MDSTTNNGMCRCCASEGTYKDVISKYSWMGDEEIYSDMLKQCFDIDLCVSSDGDNGGICEVCITQLRNAANFKKQVLNTEEQFKKHLQEKLYKSNIVKVEVHKSEDIESDNNASDDYSAPEFEVPIKEEINEVAKHKKRAAAAKATSSSAAKKPKTEIGETSTKHHNTKTVSNADKIRKKKKVIILTSDIKKKAQKIRRKNIIEIKARHDSPKPIVITRRTEVNKHLDNIREILLNSNATPIRCREGIGYSCCFCKTQFPEPADLKTHTATEHDNGAKANFMKGVPMLNYVVKLDITGLNCNICGTSIQTLEDLLDHLRLNHRKPIHSDIKNQILPFKFDSDTLKCVSCANKFNNFKLLQEHMNTHYGNYICEICGNGFVNKSTLRTHSLRHVKGVFTCDYCSKVFDTRVKKKDHERAVHKYMNKRNKCGYCGEKFTDYTKKYDHEVKMHGARPLVLKCQACSKTFDNQRSLTVHTKTYHLMERRRPK